MIKLYVTSNLFVYVYRQNACKKILESLRWKTDHLWKKTRNKFLWIFERSTGSSLQGGLGPYDLYKWSSIQPL